MIAFSKHIRRNYLIQVFGFLCVLIGLIALITAPEVRLASLPPHGTSYSSLNNAARLGSNSDICKNLQNPKRYVLISGTVNIADFNRDEGLFQTSSHEKGIFMDRQASEGGSIHLSIPLSNGKLARLLFTNLEVNAPFNFAFLIQGNGKIRMVGDGFEKVQIIGAMNIRCDDLIVGGGNEMNDLQGAMIMHISTGSDADLATTSRALDKLLDDSKHYGRDIKFQFLTYLGIALLLFGDVISNLFNKFWLIMRSRV
jgi:hypothetical protein